MSESEDFLNEVSAINSIYDERTLVPLSPSIQAADDPSTYVLRIPNRNVSLRVRFPATYPQTDRPDIISVESVGEDVKKGYGQHVLSIARELFEQGFVPGAVCLFDVLDALEDQLASEAGDEEEVRGDPDGISTGEGTITQGESRDTHSARSNTAELPGHLHHRQPDITFPPPTWHLSQPLTVKKSIFLARAIRVSSPHHAAACVAHLLERDKHAAKATHNVSAYRIPIPISIAVDNSSNNNNNNNNNNEKLTGSKTEDSTKTKWRWEEDYNDDGETAAGGRLLKQLQLQFSIPLPLGPSPHTPRPVAIDVDSEKRGVLVVVSRWYGGVKLGSARFGLICDVARAAVAGVLDRGTAKKG